jgi:hypothetical protein
MALDPVVSSIRVRHGILALPANGGNIQEEDPREAREATGT